MTATSGIVRGILSSGRRGAATAALLLAACQSDSSTSNTEVPGDAGSQLSLLCQLTTDVLFAGGVRNEIPSLLNPALVPLSDPGARYLDDYAQSGVVEARVVGLVIDGTPIAIPHNILWWHEIVNIDLGGRRLAISYCPLTGSALVFDLTDAGVQRFIISGLIFQNNLVMLDEETETLWAQMCSQAGIGDRQGTQLVQIPAIEMLWVAWKTRHPGTLVISSETGFDRDYARNPYEFYVANDLLLFPLRDSVDPRRPLKERVLGIPDGGSGGIAIPFGELTGSAETTVIQTQIAGEIVQVLWDREARAAMAFYPRTEDGGDVTLRPEGAGFVDQETGSVWNVEGQAVSGPLAGASLVAHHGAFVAYWFAWSAFHPLTRIWTGE